MVSGQPHAQAAFTPQEKAPVTIEELAGRAPEPASPATLKTRTASFYILSNSLFIKYLERMTNDIAIPLHFR
jgi:hypothetical protein